MAQTQWISGPRREFVVVEKLPATHAGFRYTTTAEKLEFRLISLQKMNTILCLVQRKITKEKELHQWNRYVQNCSRHELNSDTLISSNKANRTDIGVQVNDVMKTNAISAENYLKEMIKELSGMRRITKEGNLPDSRSHSVSIQKITENKTPVKEKAVRRENNKQFKVLHLGKPTNGYSPGAHSVKLPKQNPSSRPRVLLDTRKSLNEEKLKNGPKASKMLGTTPADGSHGVNITSVWQDLLKMEDVENSIYQHLCLMNLVSEMPEPAEASLSSKTVSTAALPASSSFKCSLLPERIKPPYPSTTLNVARELSDSLTCNLIDELADELLNLPEMFLEELLRKEFPL